MLLLQLSCYRRQDAQKKIVKKYGLPDLNPNYYITAMDQILTHITKGNPSSRVRNTIDNNVFHSNNSSITSNDLNKLYKYVFTFKVIFIFVSDDVEWVKQHLYKRVQRGFNAFVAETGKPDTVKSIGMNYKTIVHL